MFQFFEYLLFGYFFLQNYEPGSDPGARPDLEKAYSVQPQDNYDLQKMEIYYQC